MLSNIIIAFLLVTQQTAFFLSYMFFLWAEKAAPAWMAEV